MKTLLIFVLEEGQPAPETPSMWPMLIGLIAIFYFLLIRPQQKEQKRRKEMLSNIKKNDRVITTSGMYGVITNLSDDEVTLKIDDSQNIRVKFTRSAIAGPAGSAADDKKSE